MVGNHPYTLQGECPCAIGEAAVRAAQTAFEAAPDIPAFAAELERRRVIGRRIWYDEGERAILIQKVHACASGGGCAANPHPIGARCHCDHYNAAQGSFPLCHCRCGAEFYRPMFAPLLGADVVIEPLETVLSGAEYCVIAVRPGHL